MYNETSMKTDFSEYSIPKLIIQVLLHSMVSSKIPSEEQPLRMFTPQKFNTYTTRDE